jgi:hypothetical protein
VLADDRHPEVRAVAAPVLLGEGVAVVTGRIGPPSRFAQQILPLVVGEPAALPIRAGVLATVVEEADVVVLLLERLDLPLDEVVELEEVGGEVGGDREVDVAPLRSAT